MSSRCRLCRRLQSIGRVVYLPPTNLLLLLKPSCLSSPADASVVVVDYVGPLLSSRRLRRRLQSLGRVVYSSSYTNNSVVVAESSGPSSSANATVVVVNSLGPYKNLRLRCWRHLLRRVIFSASSADASAVVVDSSGSSSYAKDFVVVANSLGPSLRRHSLCCRP